MFWLRAYLSIYVRKRHKSIGDLYMHMPLKVHKSHKRKFQHLCGKRTHLIPLCNPRRRHHFKLWREGNSPAATARLLAYVRTKSLALYYVPRSGLHLISNHMRHANAVEHLALTQGYSSDEKEEGVSITAFPALLSLQWTGFTQKGQCLIGIHMV